VDECKPLAPGLRLGETCGDDDRTRAAVDDAAAAAAATALGDSSVAGGGSLGVGAEALQAGADSRSRLSST
jgi:hypothetical protein